MGSDHKSGLIQTIFNSFAQLSSTQKVLQILSMYESIVVEIHNICLLVKLERVQHSMWIHI